jgi:hypothetical protein
MGIGILNTHFANMGVEAKVYDVTPIAKDKAEAIRKYFTLMGTPESFVIIDCETTGDENLDRCLVRADTKSGGFTKYLAERAVGILSSK